MLGLSPFAGLARAQGTTAATGSAPELRGTEFDLVVAESPVNFTGNPRMATTINGSIPAPTLRWREGDTVTIRVTNRLRQLISPRRRIIQSAISTTFAWHSKRLVVFFDIAMQSKFQVRRKRRLSPRRRIIRSV